MILPFIPHGGPADFILLLGAEDGLDRIVRERLGYGHVSNWPAETFDLERDFYPFPNAHFKTVACCDLLETLAQDPMHMLDEIHRILRPGCHLVLTTRRFTLEQIRGLLENCGLEVTTIEAHGDRICGVGRKTGPLRERYPAWLYPNR